MSDSGHKQDFYGGIPSREEAITDLSPEKVIGMRMKLYPPHLEAVEHALRCLEHLWQIDFEGMDFPEHQNHARTISMLEDILKIGKSAFHGTDKNPFWGGEYLPKEILEGKDEN